MNTYFSTPTRITSEASRKVEEGYRNLRKAAEA